MFYKILRLLLLICFLASSVFSLKAKLKLKQVVGGSNNAPNQDNVTLTIPRDLIRQIFPQAAQEKNVTPSTNFTTNVTPSTNVTLTTNTTYPPPLLTQETKKDVIKIKAIYDNPSSLTEEAAKENDQKVQELITKLKELGLRDENIEYFGVSLIPRKKMQNRQFKITNENETIAKNETGEDKQLYASSEVDIQVNDTALAEKAIDLLKAQKFRIESVDYKHETKLLQKSYLAAGNELGAPSLICIEILGFRICV